MSILYNIKSYKQFGLCDWCHKIKLVEICGLHDCPDGNNCSDEKCQDSCYMKICKDCEADHSIENHFGEDR